MGEFTVQSRRPWANQLSCHQLIYVIKESAVLGSSQQICRILFDCLQGPWKQPTAHRPWESTVTAVNATGCG